jgi:hypothetical protein
MRSVLCKWNLGTDSAFAVGPKKPTENLDRVCRSQGLPDANRLTACSPAFTWNQNTFVRSLRSAQGTGWNTARNVYVLMED